MTSRAQRAAEALRQRAWEQARAELDAAIAERPDAAGLYVQRARALHGLGATDAALRDLDRALALDAGHARALCLRATMAVDARPLDHCLADLDRAIAAAPDMAGAYLARAQLRARAGQAAAAGADLDRAVELRPASAPARRGRLRFLLEHAGAAGGLERALSDVDTLLAAGEEPALHFQRARVLHRLQRGREAAAALGRVIALTAPTDRLHQEARRVRRGLWEAGAAAAPLPGVPPGGDPGARAAGADAVTDAPDIELRAADRAAQRALRRRTVRRAADPLLAAGFVHRGDLAVHARGDAERPGEAVQVLAAPDARTTAWVREPLARRSGLPFARPDAPDAAPVVELVTTLDDGGFVVTSAADGPPPREIPDGHDCLYLVPGTGAEVLLRRHLAAVDERLQRAPGVDVVLARSLDDALHQHERRRLACWRHLQASAAGVDAAPPADAAGHTAVPVVDAAAPAAAADEALARLLQVMPGDWQDGLRPGREEADIDAVLRELGEWQAPAELRALYAFRDGQEPGAQPFMPGLRLLPVDDAVSAALDLEELSGPPLLPLLRGPAGIVFAVRARTAAGAGPLYRQAAGERRLAPAYDSVAAMIETVQRCHATGACFRDGDRWRDTPAAVEAIRRACNPRAAAAGAAAHAIHDPLTWPVEWLARIGLGPTDLQPRGATVSSAALRAWTFGQWPEPAIVRGRVESPAARGRGARFVLNDGAGRLSLTCEPPWHLFVRAGAEVEALLRRPPPGTAAGAPFAAARVLPLARGRSDAPGPGSGRAGPAP